MENKILKACILDRGCYTIIADNNLFSSGVSLAKIIFEEIAKYYARDEAATAVDLDILLRVLGKKYPKQDEIFREWANRIERLQVSPANVTLYVASMREAKVLEEIQIAAQRGESSKVMTLAQSLQGLEVTNDAAASYEVYTGADISNMLVKHKRENLIRVYPSSLNDALDGGLPKGINTNCLIFAETEVGKSLFGINLAYGFCKQGLKVAYLNNEESVERMLLRFMIRFCSHGGQITTKQDLQENYTACHERAVESGWENLSVVPLGPGNTGDLKTWAGSGVDCLIIDQLLNLESGQDDSLAAKSTVSKALRSVGKNNNIITVGLAQANIRKDKFGNTNPKLILDKGDVYGSNVAVPGDLDLMIGLGINEEFQQKDYRYVNICKNKVSGRNIGFPVRVIPAINKVVSL